ncbi:hypothetical protein SAMN02745216_01352 [Desulfatibacillum alkenivorans DSM 16219]|uniref:Uncharacterized protein n=1 Tax=Desulfatibacillum alkenivorans DSM 16219 TaxID=1121393 RepID=A0A1M6I4P9_9BACT|nr:hypothetical protein SAMN02745216_01352 [Desulfatibacillum alkenivorans DSM 16219]
MDLQQDNPAGNAASAFPGRPRGGRNYNVLMLSTGADLGNALDCLIIPKATQGKPCDYIAKGAHRGAQLQLPRAPTGGRNYNVLMLSTGADLGNALDCLIIPKATQGKPCDYIAKGAHRGAQLQLPRAPTGGRNYNVLMLSTGADLGNALDCLIIPKATQGKPCDYIAKGAHRGAQLHTAEGATGERGHSCQGRPRGAITKGARRGRPAR